MHRSMNCVFEKYQFYKQKVNKFLVLDLFPFHLVQDYHLVEGFSWTPSSSDVLKLVGVVYRQIPVFFYC